jgi:hypothetical protein
MHCCFEKLLNVETGCGLFEVNFAKQAQLAREPDLLDEGGNGQVWKPDLRQIAKVGRGDRPVALTPGL